MDSQSKMVSGCGAVGVCTLHSAKIREDATSLSSRGALERA